ncbi:cytochrome P450 [Streptomyces sp. NPDC059153]|uniref:cytochrome P450 n=1 Tax=Streptomyces sp. NPDC059153 TaxID=3346743 RepID=UPI0036AA1516
MLSALVAVRDEEDGRLSEEELVGTAMMLVVAGHESTVNLLGNAVLALLQHPEQLELLRERPELMPGAVEELLRYDTSVERSTSRYASEDLELGGAPIPRGSMITVALGSAGHDAPQAEGDDPAVLDVTRPGARHLAFGHGIHYCLGAPLARLETMSPCVPCSPASPNWNSPPRWTRSTGSAPGSSAVCCPFRCAVASADGRPSPTRCYPRRWRLTSPTRWIRTRRSVKRQLPSRRSKRSL